MGEQMQAMHLYKETILTRTIDTGSIPNTTITLQIPLGQAKTRGDYPRFGSMRYTKENGRYSKPSVIQQHDFPRLPSIQQNQQTHYHQSKKQWKRTQTRASSHHHSP